MAKKFNPKIFQGKNRVYLPAPGCIGILKLWVWDTDVNEYRVPSDGKVYDVRRYEIDSQGKKIRVKRYFRTLEEARAWQHHLPLILTDAPAETVSSVSPPVPVAIVPIVVTAVVPEPPVEHAQLFAPSRKKESEESSLGPTFGEIYEAFQRKKLSVLSQGTQGNYERFIRLYFQDVLPKPIREITPNFIDDWIDFLRASVGRHHQSKSRSSFDHELSVMRSVLRFYANYYEDPEFRFPIKARHAEDAEFGKSRPKLKDLREDEFFAFRNKLEAAKHGRLMSYMATVQFYQALRISEVAGLYFEDLNLNFQSPKDSTIRVCRHVVYPRNSSHSLAVMPGFKNASGGDRSVKELYLFPESFAALKAVFKAGATGLVFGASPQEPFTYRQIQKSFDDAFARARLPYRGTHILRHGGCRRVYNATGGDLALAQQLLGNDDLESTLVYAQRDRGALREHVQRTWAQVPNSSSLVADGRTAG